MRDYEHFFDDPDNAEQTGEDDGVKTMVIGLEGSVRLDQVSAQDVRNTLASPGWKYLTLMFEKDKAMTAKAFLEDNRESTPEQVGAVKGAFRYADTMSNLQADTERKFNDAFAEKEDNS